MGEQKMKGGVKIAVFASGRGSNFQAIVYAIKAGRLDACLSLLVCDSPDAPVIKKAQDAGVKIALIQRKYFKSKEEFEKKIIEYLERENINLIVLAGFMRLLSPYFVNRYKNKILNIHPSLLPCFKGEKGIKDAFDYGVKVTGVTVHLVDEQMDHGPIILQETVKIGEDDTLETVEAKIHKLEHKLYPLAIKLYTEKRLRIKDRKIEIVK